MATSPELQEHQSYVPDKTAMREFTLRAVLSGSVLGLIFGASSLYLVLKVGLTVSASIPVAVLAVTLFRAFGLKLSILENNIVQTAGSAGESIAFGVGVTMPALMLLGFDMTLTRVMFVSVVGGMLGILMMIPLRRAFIVNLHQHYPNQPGTLLYPEGTACAEVLKSAEKGGASGGTVFLGFFVAFVHKFICEGMKLLRESVALPLTFLNRSAVLAGDMASELLGVGYILGIRTGGVMMAGAVLGYLVLIPTIAIFGGYSQTAIPPGKVPISAIADDKIVGAIRNQYLLFIGAGCVAAAGIISMFKTMPMIVRSFRAGLGGLSAGGGGQGAKRTEKDLPMGTVLVGSLALVAILAAYLMTEVNTVAAVLGGLLVVLFGFLFVTVSSRLTGEVGSTSNPISGMTVATLTMTCLIFLALGWTSPTERVLALTIGAVVCIAASNGGTTSQDLKTGYLVGGTPRYQQYAIIVGAVTSALLIGGTLLAFNKAGTVYSSDPKNLPNVVVPSDELAKLGNEEYEGKSYKVWRPSEELVKEGKAEVGRYLVDDGGKPAYLVDPAVVGRLETFDDGKKVDMKFPAPKTAVIGIIINGVLKQDLKWDYIILGALIAVTLELCGISSLAFAVGVYVPIGVSVPIFLGGLVRWGVDAVVAKRRAAAGAQAATDEVAAIRETETSPGVLLASGYIAGGSLGGVLIAFLNFNQDILSKIQIGELPAFKDLDDTLAQLLSLAAFGLLAVFVVLIGTQKTPPEVATRPK